MGDAQKTSVVLLVVGILVSVICLANYWTNIQPRYHYFSEAIECLEEAQKESALHEKLLNIDEAVEIYRAGVSQRNLQALKSLQESEAVEEIDYWIPQVMKLLDDEQTGLNFPPRRVALTVLLLAFMGVAVVGSWYDYDSWSTDERHLYIAVVSALMLAIIVGLIP